MARDLVSFSFTHNHNCKLNFKFNRARDLDRMNDFRQTDNGLNQECVPVLGLKNAVEFESAADLMTAATRAVRKWRSNAWSNTTGTNRNSGATST